MIKITKGSIPDTYTVASYMYIKETGFHVFVYSIANKPWETLEHVLQGRISDIDELEWVRYIVKLTKCDAIINDRGELQAVPIKKEASHEARERVYET